MKIENLVKLTDPEDIELTGGQRDPCMQAVGIGMAGDGEEIPRFTLPTLANQDGTVSVIFQLGVPAALPVLVVEILRHQWRSEERVLLGKPHTELGALVASLLRGMVSRGELTRSIHGGGAWTYIQHGLSQDEYERRTRL